MFKRTEIYTLSEYREIMNQRELLILDANIGYLKKNNKEEYLKLVVMTSIFVLSSTITIFAGSSFDPAGNALFDLVVGIAKWVFIARGAWEIIQKMTSGCDIADISSVVTKYGMGYGAIILLPKLLDLLESALKMVKL